MPRQKTDDQVGIAFFGFGYWGGNYVRVFRELPNSWDLVVCDPKEDRLKEAGQRFSGLHLTTDMDEALARDGVDAAVVCTGAASHYEVTRRCLEAGKHVLVEKPITTISAEGKELVELAKSKGLTLMVCHTFLYNPGVLKVREYIDKGDVGRIYYMYASRTNMGPIRHDVNALWDLAPHDISIFNYWLDDVPEWVSAVGSRVLGSQNEDVGFVVLGYANGIMGHIHVSWTDPNKVREVVLVGSDRRIVFNDVDASERVRVFEKGVAPAALEAPTFGEYQFLMRDGGIISPKIPLSEPLKNQCVHFLECVKEGKQPFTSGTDGVNVVRVMEAIDRSLQQQGGQVPVE